MSLANATIATRMPARDLARARGWYHDKLGLDPVEERDGGLRYVLAGSEFCLFTSTGGADGSFTQMAVTVPDLDATLAALRAAGLEVEEYDFTEDGVASIQGNYPSKGSGERAAWFRDSEGNLMGIAETIP